VVGDSGAAADAQKQQRRRADRGLQSQPLDIESPLRNHWFIVSFTSRLKQASCRSSKASRQGRAGREPSGAPPPP
jgi:hypothetical protein